jgi:nucleoid-associated protein YgaU
MVAYVHLAHRQRRAMDSSERFGDDPIALRTNGQGAMPLLRPQPANDPGVTSAGQASSAPTQSDGAGAPMPLPSVSGPTIVQLGQIATSRPAAEPERAESALPPIAAAPGPASLPAVDSPSLPRPEPLVRATAGRPAAPPRPSRQHRIVDGDTLPRLADYYLGDERRYLEIFQANRHLLVQPDLLPLGERLWIPNR